MKVWYDTRNPNAFQKAVFIRNTIDQEIWPTLIDGLGFRAPLSDGDIGGCNGGDGLLDIYIVDMKTMGEHQTDLGETFAEIIPRPSEYPVFILINQLLEGDELKGALTHEFAHASQWAYPVASPLGLSAYDWLKDSTAQWAIDAVYPHLHPLPPGSNPPPYWQQCTTPDFEQCWAPPFLMSPEKSLDYKDPKRIYGSYLFFQFLAEIYGPSIVREIWDATTVNGNDQLSAVDNAIPNHHIFVEQWPKFAKWLWNADPHNPQILGPWLDDGFSLMPKPLFEIAVTPGDSGSTAVPLGEPINHLSTNYYHLNVDQNVRFILFHNRADVLTSDSRISVGAFIKIQDQWTYSTWNDAASQYKAFCLDKKTERIQDFYLVVTNASLDTDAPQLDDAAAAWLSVSNVGCWRWSVQSSLDEIVTGPEVSPASTKELNSIVTGTADVGFQAFAPSIGSVPTVTLSPFSGTVNGTETVDELTTQNGTNALLSTCHTTANITGPVASSGETIQLQLGVRDGPSTSPPPRGIPNGAFGSSVLLNGIGAALRNCVFPDRSPTATLEDFTSISWLWLPSLAGDGKQAVVDAQGNITGSYTWSISDPIPTTYISRWSMSPLREP